MKKTFLMSVVVMAVFCTITLWTAAAGAAGGGDGRGKGQQEEGSGGWKGQQQTRPPGFSFERDCNPPMFQWCRRNDDQQVYQYREYDDPNDEAPIQSSELLMTAVVLFQAYPYVLRAPMRNAWNGLVELFSSLAILGARNNKDELEPRNVSEARAMNFINALLQMDDYEESEVSRQDVANILSGFGADISHISEFSGNRKGELCVLGVLKIMADRIPEDKLNQLFQEIAGPGKQTISATNLRNHFYASIPDEVKGRIKSGVEKEWIKRGAKKAIKGSITKDDDSSSTSKAAAELDFLGFLKLARKTQCGTDEL